MKFLILYLLCCCLVSAIEKFLFKETCIFFPRPTLRRLRPEDMFETWVRKYKMASALLVAVLF